MWFRRVWHRSGSRLRVHGRMPIMPRIVVGLCLLAVALLGAGCAEPGARPGGTPSTAPTWGNFALEVAGVVPGPGARSVTITVRPPTGCSRNLAVTNATEENGNIYANVVARSLTTSGPPLPASGRPVGG